ncbi:MAG: FtsW/RodA/SpoVE family cell cycle protein [Coprobacillaceae bacterium]
MHSNKKVTINYLLIGLLFLLCIVSCIAIKSSAPLITKIANPENLWFRQLMFFGLSFILMFIVYKFGNDRIYQLVWIAYGIFMILLIGLVVERFAIMAFGRSIVPLAKTTNGATSWYVLPSFDLQPSEFMKVILVLVLSKVISAHNNLYPVHRFRTDCLMLGKVLAISLPPCILIYLQNDAGVTLIILVSIVFVLFVSGLQARWFVVGGVIIGAVLAIAIYLFLFQHDTFVDIIGGGYKMNRFYGWIDPERTYSNEGYQLFNALIAFGTGGMFGHGFQSSVMPFPEAQTDFIFAVIAQDFGFVGGILTILLVVAFDAALIYIGMRSTTDRDKYYVAGIFGMLIFQQVWNIAMVMGLVPITGITLPFISYGGSSLLSYMIAIGVFLDIDKQSKIIASKGHLQDL